jgi:peptide/nickel transport system permease protein
MSEAQAALAPITPREMTLRPQPRLSERAGRFVRQQPIGVLGIIIIVIVVITAVFSPQISPYDPTSQKFRRLLPPSQANLLGTDELGRDTFSRIVYGSRISLQVGIIAVSLALSIGVTLGVISGYIGGTFDNLVMRVVDLLFAFPGLVLAIVIAGLLGPSITNAMIAIGIIYAPTYARVARGSVLTVKNELYLEAARLTGGGHFHIIRKHIAPNILAPLVVLTTLSMSTAILTEAALSFLGLGTQPPDPAWGKMLSDGRRFMEIAPWVTVFPGIAIVIAVLGFNLLGDGLRDALDPRLKE